MKIINERYHIIRKISETNNSMNYLVKDDFSGEQCLLKMLNRNVAHPFPLEYFKKEYILNSLLNHPLIRNPISFELCVNIDGNPMSEPEYFFCTGFYENPILTVTDYGSFIPQIADVLVFLHENGFFHGDIRKENYFLTGNRLVLFDISAFIPADIGKKDDLKKIKDLIKPHVGYPLPKEIATARDLAGKNDDTELHMAMFSEAVYKKDIPLCILFPRHAAELTATDEDSCGVLLYHVGDVQNAWYWLHSLIPEIETAGFRKIIIDQLDKHDMLSLMRPVIRYAAMFEKTQSVIHEFGAEYSKIENTLAYTPSAINMNAVEEEAKLLRLSLHLLDALTAIHPVVLVFPDLSLIDPLSVELMKKMQDILGNKRIRILIATDSPLNIPGLHVRECPVLNAEECVVLLRYFSYYYPLQSEIVRSIISLTNGETAAITAGLKKVVEEKACIFRDGYLAFTEDCRVFFNNGSDLAKLLAEVSTETLSAIHALSIFDGSFPVDFLDHCDTLYKTYFQQAISLGLVVIINGYYRCRNKNILEHVQSIPADDLEKALIAYTRTLVKDLPQYLIPIKNSMFRQKLYDEFVSLMIETAKERENAPNLKDAGQYFWQSIVDAEKVIDILSQPGRFFVLERLLWGSDRFGGFDTAALLSRLKNEVTSKEDRWRYLTVYFSKGKPTNEELDEAEQEIACVPDDNVMTKWRLTTNYMNRLTDTGLYERSLQLYYTFLESMLPDVNPRMQFEAYIMLNVIYSRMGVKDKSWDYLEKMRLVSEAHPDQIHEDSLFTLYNNYYVFFRQTGNDENAFEYAFKAIAAAQKSQDYRKLSLIHNNMGAGFFWQNQRKKACEYYLKSFDYAQKGKLHDIILLASRNLADYYITTFHYSDALHTYEAALETFEKSNSINQKSNTFKIAIELFYEIGAWSDAYAVLEKERKLVLPRTHSLIEEFHYYSLEFICCYQREGREKAWDYLSGIEKKPSLNAEPRSIMLMYMYCIHYTYLKGDKESVCAFISYFDEHADQQLNNLNYNFTALLMLLKIWVGWEAFKPDCVQIALIEEHTVLILYFYLFCKSCSKRDIMYYEHLFHAVRLLQFAYSQIPEDKKSGFITASPLMEFYGEFLDQNSIKLHKFDKDTFVKNYSDKSVRYISSSRNAFFKSASFSNISETDIMIKKAMSEAMILTGFQRGIYFEYDKSAGWVKRVEVCDEVWFKHDEDYAEEIVVGVLQERQDKLQYWRRSYPCEGLGLSTAICFPIIDITMTRDRYARKAKSSSSTSLHHLLSLKGAFYFDTKRAVIQPQREDINHMFYLREMINIAMYYNSLKGAMLLDPLTKLYKRDAWFDMMRAIMGSAGDMGKKMTVMMTDIDFFKSVNDVYGHKTGDAVLENTAGIVMKALRTIDLGGRYGGEEFIFCLIDTSGDTAQKVADRLRQSVERATLLPDRKITISAGLAYYPEDGTLLSDLIEKADKALLAAKESGRNKCLSWGNCKAHADSIIMKKTPVIANPSREKDKIDLIVELLDDLSVSSGPVKLRSETADICIRYLDIDEVVFLRISSGIMSVDPPENAVYIKNTGELPELITDQCTLFAARPGDMCRFGLYFKTRSGSQKPLVEKRFYRFIANIILDRLIASTVVTGTGE